MEDKIILLDGAIGTEILKVNKITPYRANTKYPLLVRSIHEKYLQSGSDYIITNTFGLNHLTEPDDNIYSEIAFKAIENARFNEYDYKLLYDISPIFVDNLTNYDRYKEYVKIVSEVCSDVDGFILETFFEVNDLVLAVKAVRSITDKELFVSFNIDQSNRTFYGNSIEEVVRRVEAMNVDYIGLNCIPMKSSCEMIEKVLKVSTSKVFVKPCLQYLGGEYVEDINDFLECLPKYHELGVSAIGSCCGSDYRFIEKASYYKGKKVNREIKEKKRYLISEYYRACAEVNNVNFINNDFLILKSNDKDEVLDKLINYNGVIGVITEDESIKRLCNKLGGVVINGDN